MRNSNSVCPRLHLFLFFAVFICCSTNVISQKLITIKGTVSDGRNADPLPGVSVLVRGTNNGTSTDGSGKYTITVSSNAVLIFRSVGFAEKRVDPQGKTTLDVSMAMASGDLGEVVVVGYGEMRKSDVTGAISQYKNTDVSERPALSASQMLQGKLPGVQIAQNSGAPGSASTFSIRGASTLGTGQPLFVIDGFPVDNSYINPTNVEQGTSYHAGAVPPTDILSTLNPNEIESIEVLKDASATAIYGSRGANGVVMITTKMGKLGRTQVEYNFRADMSRIPKQINVLKAGEFISYMNEGSVNDKVDSVYTQEEIATLNQGDFNWQDEIYQTGITRDHQLTLSGGNQASRYSLIGGYTNFDGIVKNSNYTRGSLRFNFTREITKKFNIKLSLTGSMSNNTRHPQGHTGSIVAGSIVGGAIYRRPFDKPYNDKDEINEGIVDNPLTTINKQSDLLQMTQLLPNLGFEYKFSDHLKARYNAGMNWNTTTRDMYYPRGTNSGNAFAGKSYYDTHDDKSFLSDFTLNFTKELGKDKKHYIDITAGYNWQQWNGRSFSIAAVGYPNDLLQGNNMGLASANLGPRSGRYKSALSSFIGRAVYSYDDRYVVTLTGRTDGSTRLAEGHKWASFPAAGVAWNMHNEAFFKRNELISQLKLRASYGVSGRQSVAIGASQERLGIGLGTFGDGWITAINYGSISNPGLGWESTKQANLGVDLAFMKSRYTLSVDVYKKNTSNLLTSLPIPLSTGFESYSANGGEIENKGLEVMATAKVLQGKLDWSISANFSFNRNKVISLEGPQTMFGNSYFVNDEINQTISIVTPGHPIGEFYGYRINGIYQNTAEVTAGPEPTARPGDFRFVDLSGPDGKPDGTINDFDRTFIGSPYPDYTFGLSNNFQYKKLALSVFIQGNIGQDVANLNRVFLDALSNSTNSNVRQEAYDGRWTGEGTSNYFPRASAQKPLYRARLSDFLIEDASFVRLKTVILSYSFAFNKYLKSVKVFAAANNLVTLTDYSGYDPEVNIYGNSAINQGVDLTTMPNTKTFSCGINVSF